MVSFGQPARQSHFSTGTNTERKRRSTLLLPSKIKHLRIAFLVFGRSSGLMGCELSACTFFFVAHLFIKKLPGCCFITPLSWSEISDELIFAASKPVCAIICSICNGSWLRQWYTDFSLVLRFNCSTSNKFGSILWDALSAAAVVCSESCRPT